jgi:hypothetical protein
MGARSCAVNECKQICRTWREVNPSWMCESGPRLQPPHYRPTGRHGFSNGGRRRSLGALPLPLLPKLRRSLLRDD